MTRFDAKEFAKGNDPLEQFFGQPKDLEVQLLTFVSLAEQGRVTPVAAVLLKGP